MGISDTSKAWVLAIGLAIAVGLAGVMFRPLSLFLCGMVTGPGLLAVGLLGRHIFNGWLLWGIGAVAQFIFIYHISLWANSRPILWQLRVGLLVFAWLAMGYVGWWMVK